MMQIYHKLTVQVLLITAVFMAGQALAEGKKPVGQVSIEEKEFGLILGGSMGSGTLTFQGQEHPFKLKGLSAGVSVGVSKMSAAGEVYDMTDLSQFPGTYTKLDASVALGGGMGGMHLKNENGVIMSLHSRTQGLELNLGSMSGMTVILEH